METIEDIIDKRIGEVRIETIDISFGEIISLHEQNEIIIRPEDQRTFRWSLAQRSRFIESILLKLPIPPIFTIEAENGVLELIDGLQRICSVIHFIEFNQLDELEDALQLEGCDIIPELNGKYCKDLSLRLKLNIKRASMRMVVIKKQSKIPLKHEMLKRLNTGGSILTPQEIG